jgi:biopolymer transport protein ExbD
MEFEGRARIRTQLDVTPLIDVVFLLLIFFLLTSTFITPEAIELSLPTSGTGTPSRTLPVVVSLDRYDELRVGERQVTLQQLEAVLSQSLSNRERKAVTLKADSTAELQRLLQVMDRIRAAGAAELSLATRPQSSGSR